MWTTMWDDISKTPYAVNGDKWISYDDEHSVAEKVNFYFEF
jgi:GH18 family chitinase